MKWSRLREGPAAAGLIAIIALIATLSTKQVSVTADEAIHLSAGLSYLQQHDARINVEHPPLMKVLAALPVLIAGANCEYDGPSWRAAADATFGHKSLRSWGLQGERLIFLSRLPMIGLTVVLAFLVYRMARGLSGSDGGLLSLCIFGSTPFFYAYGPLVLTDIGVALFVLLTVWTFTDFWSEPTRCRAVVVGLSFAGALLTKFSAGLLLPCLVVLALILKTPATVTRRKRFWLSALAMLLACLLVYGAYAILFRETDVSSLLARRLVHSKRPISLMQTLASVLEGHEWVSRLLSPMILYGLGVSATLHALPRPTYLMGHVYARGTYLYFPTLFTLKMTIGFLLLSGMLLGLARRSIICPSGESGRHRIALLTTFSVFTLAALVSPLNIGIRHVSVSITTLTILLGLVAPLANAIGRRWLRLSVFSLIGFATTQSVWTTATSYPYYLSYFNEFVGRSRQYRITSDSNLDWGQSIIAVRELAREHRIDSIALDIKGSVPELYIQRPAEFLCEQGVPLGAQWAVIGASRFISGPDLAVDAKTPLGRCDYLFGYPNRAVAGGAAYIFKLDRSAAPTALTFTGEREYTRNR